MSEIEFNEESKIILEKLKGRTINKKRLLYYTLITAIMAVVFGLVAGITFVSLTPVLNNKVETEEQFPEILFPEDPEEMLPEEMVLESEPVKDEPEYEEIRPDNVSLDREQVQQMISTITLDIEDYKNMYGAMSAYTDELTYSLVTITCSFTKKDWLDNVQITEKVSPGVFIAEDNEQYYILADYTSVKKARKINVALAYENKHNMSGTLKGYDPITDIAIISIRKEDVPKIVNDRKTIKVAAIGSSNVSGLEGVPVVALGSPVGYIGSKGYGMINSTAGEYLAQDGNYKVLQTDICGSTKGQGFIFNLNGELMGMITQRGSYDVKNLVTAYSISDLKPRMNRIIKEKKFAGVGITGGDVPKSAHKEYGIPYGAYVESVMSESPAMVAGMQQGDVITIMDGKKISNFSEFSSTLQKKNPGTTVEMTIMRLVQDEYRELTVEVNLSELE